MGTRLDCYEVSTIRVSGWDKEATRD